MCLHFNTFGPFSVFLSVCQIGKVPRIAGFGSTIMIPSFSQHFFSFRLTRVSHWAEDTLSDGHNGVGSLVVAPNGLSPWGVLTNMLQEISQSLTHHAGCCAHLQYRRCTSSTLALCYLRCIIPCFLFHGGGTLNSLSSLLLKLWVSWVPSIKKQLVWFKWNELENRYSSQLICC